MKTNNDCLGERQKKYELASTSYLPIRIPIILRLDGEHFRSYLKGVRKPFDENVIHCMNEMATYLCNNIQNACFAYTQSDEISILLNTFKDVSTQPWFENNVQKMVSTASGLASPYFSLISDRIFGKQKLATFDCRVFAIPKEDVVNNFWWRESDAIRNSAQSLARSLYSHSECNNKNVVALKEMSKQKGQDWNELPLSLQRGRAIYKQKYQKGEVWRSKWIVDNNIPIFYQHPDYILRHLTSNPRKQKDEQK